MHVHCLHRARQEAVDAFCETPSNHLEPLSPVVSTMSLYASTSLTASSNATNTIHVDDLVSILTKPSAMRSYCQQSRNFALNPKEGLKIHAFKGAHTVEGMADRELDKLTLYMLHISNVNDFRTLSHKVGRSRD